MLKKNHRLNRTHFDEVFRSGKASHSPYFMIRTIKANSFEEFAFSVVVSKKVARLATLRNRNKRKMYSALKMALEGLNKPYKGIFILKKDISSIPTSEISKEILKTLE